MKISAHIVTLLLFFSLALFAQTTEKSPSPAKHPASPKTEDCASRNPKSPYTFTKHLPHTAAAEAKGYDVDYHEPEAHDPICLSVTGGDGVLWYPSLGKPFKLKISHKSGGHNCGSHPFQKEPCSDYVLGCYSGPARSETVGCVYDVKFQRPGEKESDPHIRITP